MIVRSLLRLNSRRRLAGYLSMLAILGLPFAVPALAQTLPTSPAPQANQPPSAETLKNWRGGMAQTPPAKNGCFTSTYPSTQWQEVPCTTGPALPYPPARGPRPGVVGNGNDVSASVSGHISTAIGSFDSVTGVTSETGSGTGQTNDFSLQLNANFFTSSACSGAANPSQCLGWQQFVYSNYETNSAFMQYWLINYAAACPSGWFSYQSDCYTNSAAISVPQQIATNLANLSLIGQAIAGGKDAIIFSTGTTLYAVLNNDSMVSLSQGWQEAEWNIVGDCCGYQANFNSGSTIVVRTAVDSGTPSAPSCDGQGFTGETNNLSFANSPNAKRGTSPAVVFTESSSGSAPSACASATTDASGALTDSHDVNRDGDSDIVWREGAGNLALWLMNGASVSSVASLGNISAGWSIVGQRDFNGDGAADLLWFDTLGNVAIWLMNGRTVVSNAALGNAGSGWLVAGTGDFNGDGLGDILWKDGNGDLAVWLMNGSSVLSAAGLGNVGGWSVVGIGDFNGDGKADVLWRSTTGVVAIWFMNGTTIVSTASLGTVDTVWSVVGTADFNGDGRSDIVWRDTSGNVAVWQMNGGLVSSNVGLGNVSTWTVAETGDFNGDGKSDILWVNSGNLAIWFMNGTTVSSIASLGNVGGTWAVQGAHAD